MIKEFKPVNEACIDKVIFVRCKSEHPWARAILTGIFTDGSYTYQSISSEIENTKGKVSFTGRQIRVDNYAKRCPDITYGDEDE